MAEDVLDLLLYLARQQTNIVEIRDDTSLHILLDHALEIITLQETSTVVSKTAHPFIWDEFTWDFGTWA